MKITPQERNQRENQNQRAREKRAKERRKGLCRCGERLSKNPKTKRNFTLCDTCRVVQSAAAARRYRGEKPAPAPRRPIKMDARLKDQVNLRRRLERDGMGRTDWWWVATATGVDGRQRSTRFSIARHGDLGAFRLARQKRDEWERERGF